MATAEGQRLYRARVAAGEITPRPRPLLLPPVAVLTDDERGELESRWQVEYRRVMASWLLRQRSQHTRQAYQRAWTRWVEWCNLHDYDPVNVDAPTAAVWVAELRQEFKPASVQLWRTAVRAALLELSAEGLRSGGDPFGRVPHERPPAQSSTPGLTNEQVAEALRVATGLGGQHRTAVLMLAVMGLRSFEAAQVNRGTVAKSPWGPVARIVGKGGKAALVPIPPIVQEAAAIDGWPTDGSRSKGRERIRYLLHAVSAGCDGFTVAPHQFRHWFVTAALEAGVPLQHVQDSARHADPKTTQGYNRARDLAKNNAGFVVAGLPAIVGTVAP